MKTSIATVSISGTLREKLEAIAKAGFDGIEIFEQDFIADTRPPREIGAMIRDQGLEITLFQPFRDFEGLTGAARQRAFDRATHKFDTMAELDTDLILVCSSVHPEALGGIDRAADDFRALGEIAAERGLRVGYEALAWGRHVNDHRDAWEIVRRADHPNIGLILDSFHTLARRIDPDTIRRIPADKIFFVQLADAPAIDMDLLYWSRHFRNMPGEGDLAVTNFMRAVVATGYDGPVSLEIFNDQFRGGRPEGLARDGYLSLVALMDDVRQAEPDIQTQLPRIPARARFGGVAFIEFATRGSEAEALARLLETMGFAHVGDHISKKVALWQQGDIRIVLNQERQGYASAAYLTHGTTICDVGMTVQDAAATSARAAALGAATFDQPVGPGELQIPAIRSVGGSLMHFIDDQSGLSEVWDVEFIPVGAVPEGGAGLTRIDHLAETMNYDEMLSWSLFYTSIFEMERTPMVDVIDPDGLVRSQAIKAKGGAARITLNGAETHRTLAGSFLADSFGGAVQHVAFATDDIFDTARRMAEAGFTPLPMTGNYYSDLQARFGLEPARLAEMQALSILYDEDADGAFYQFYSQPFAGGLFFEIVQRCGGYDGYGAPNAPFRIAAQKRLLQPKGMPRR
ncbi:bifunctional sugar phosphate isomerase/epimerase/4-hydroxyphenylpyruvate dioxygenase family protein [Pseudoruegeria sp. SHC-113]|uniref:bifunctional sugar phosphate isomerase/epimerase/4-hydroxyphenylpyruvate dioxygenase family protein n=1 Tax=Pseudoruegeria sp. SHC-113 TaxID=2855439 RepID=UPI0021BA569B|nr:sugar phosphate isomerase/epimerase and 4-hydroxyphenylpyruvate domain-containing protein [Pseudoruegeria sp. SHC-113]MCT8162207.1 sugar phosphate isomerase/epimerase and 4-hydroxyphenylpyruvate domain-containing protein [Pseudoruegeria sp. SHC-113]